MSILIAFIVEKWLYIFFVVLT